jgi:hypothetical protein
MILRYLGCELAINDAVLAEILGERWNIGELDDRPLGWRIDVALTGEIPPPIRAAVREQLPDERGLVVLDGTHGAVGATNVAWLVSAASAARVEIAAARPGTFVTVFGDVRSDPMAAHVAVAEAVAASGLLPIHGAVVHRAGHTVALVGPSGAGKSTSAVLAALEGWELLAEDSAWLDPQTLLISGADAGVRLRPGAETMLSARLANRFGIDLDAQPHDGLKRLLAYETFGRRRRSAYLSELVALTERDGPCGSAPLRPAQVAMALHQAGGIPSVSDLRAASSRRVAQVSARLPGRLVSARSGASGLDHPA